MVLYAENDSGHDRFGVCSCPHVLKHGNPLLINGLFLDWHQNDHVDKQNMQNLKVFGTYPLVNIQIAIENGPVEIVDLPII